MEQNSCKDCINFRQHYALNNKKLFRVYFGHCTRYSPKAKRPDAAACEHFEPASPDEDAFVSREYLSKELLQYVLKLELLPEIGDP
ncbi:MAG: hypothetical protein IJW41_01375 [Oscillospiraceae bacterium]|nr:hypothetical protein [Oscillospiraceae bacterium]